MSDEQASGKDGRLINGEATAGPRNISSSLLVERRVFSGEHSRMTVSPGGRSLLRKLNETAYSSLPNTRTLGQMDRNSSQPLIVRRGNEDMIRRPYHYSNERSQNRESSPLLRRIEDPEEAAMYHRFRFYTSLHQHSGVDLNLAIPHHVVPASFFQIHIPGVKTSEGKQSSIVTIFSIWNTMMGTSLLSMPWALMQSGLLAGLMFMVLEGGICFLTAFWVIRCYKKQRQTNSNVSEMGDLCGLILGKWADVLCNVFSVEAIGGAGAVYYVLMSNFLYSTVDYIYNHDSINVAAMGAGVVCGNSTINIDGHTIFDNDNDSFFDDPDSLYHKLWGQFSTVPVFLTILLFPLINFKSATFFTKFNSLGTISIIFILGSVLYRCYTWGLNAEFYDEESSLYVPLFRWSFPSLTGILSLGLFIHNAIITIMSNNKNPENNARDMGIAFSLVTGTYAIVGTAFYLAFPVAKSCIEDNLLNNFMPHDVLNFVSKVFLLFQMTTVFPLLMYLLRVTVFYAIYKNIYPSKKHVLFLNAMVVVACIMFAIYLPHIGTIIRFSGAACGLVMIFFLPALINIAHMRQDGPVPVLTYLLHITIVVLGLANFSAQFLI